MLVTSLEEMESIVRSRGDLEWDGYDVIKYTNSDNAMYGVDGVLKNGKWMKKKVFPLTENGLSLIHISEPTRRTPINREWMGCSQLLWERLCTGGRMRANVLEWTQIYSLTNMKRITMSQRQ